MAVKKRIVRKAATPKTTIEIAARREIAQKIKEAKSKISEVYTDEEIALVKLLKETEDLTRSIVGIEMEIRRQRLVQKDLFENRKVLAAELDSLERENAAMANRHKEIEKQHKKLADQKESVQEASDGFAKENAELERESKSLADDVKKLEAKNGKLRDDIEKLQRLKEEYMRSIAKFKELREELIP